MSRCVVLMYQVVGLPQVDGEARFCGTPDAFAAEVQYLADNGWSVIYIGDMLANLRAGRPPGERLVATTFYDGTACICEAALPVLAQHGPPASVCMVSESR